MAKKKDKRRFVDFMAKDEDHECALLGAFGFSSNFINHETGLSSGQIQYRLGKAEISRVDFRNGTSPWAKQALRNLRSEAEPGLNEYLRKYSTDHQKKVTGGYQRRGSLRANGRK